MKNLLATLCVFCVTFLFNVNAFGADKKIIIGYHKTPGHNEKTLIESKRGRIKNEYKHIRAISAEIDESELAELLNNPDVAYIEEDTLLQAINPISNIPLVTNAAANVGIEYDNAWSVSHIGAQIPHGQSFTGAGIDIAILDTGIDYNHPDLDINYSGGDNFISLDVNNHDPYDDSYNSHGTHVAGVIAAELDGAGVVGVAPDASIYAVKVLDGAGFGSVSSIVAGIDWAIANQMDIINMSMGMSTHSQLLSDACAAADAAGILLVAAAGNTYAGPVLYPAAYPSVIAVGATTIFDDIAPISSSGPELELVAPGLNVYSTVVGGGHGYLGGTSQSAPHVTGLAALITSAGMVSDANSDGVINHHDTRILLQTSAIDLGSQGFDELYGYGLASATNLFSDSGGDGGNPITHLTIEKSKKSHKHNAQHTIIEDGIYDVTIVNTSLRALKMLVFEDHHIRRDLSQKIKFTKDKPQEISFSLDATGTSLKLIFIPKGKKASLADVYIQMK